MPNKLTISLAAVVNLAVILTAITLYLFTSLPWVVLVVPLLIIGLATVLVAKLIQPLQRQQQQLANQLQQTHQQATQQTGQAVGLASIEKNKLDTILASIEEGIVVVNLARQIILINSKATQLTGYTNTEVVGLHPDHLMLIQDKSGRRVNATEYCPVISNVPQNYHSEDNYLILTGKNNLKSAVTIDSTLANSTTHTDIGWIILLHDRQHQKEMEAIQLDFVSMASHELRAPLTSIKGYLSVFMEENKDKLTADQQGLLDRMTLSAQQLGSLVDNLLSVSKVERGAFTVNLVPLDWTAILTTAVDQGKLLAAQKNITLELQLPPTPLPQVMADNIRVNEVINNLISNAINYTANIYPNYPISHRDYCSFANPGSNRQTS